MIETENPVQRYLVSSVESHRILGMQKPKGYAYASLEDFVLQHGQAWMPGKRPRRVRQGVPQHCYDNTYKLVTSTYGRVEGLRYVEGYAKSVMCVLHAWAVTPDGVVIDPTWVNAQDREYYGVELPMDLVDAAVLLHGYYGVLDDWRNDYPMLMEPYEPVSTLHRLRELGEKNHAD